MIAVCACIIMATVILLLLIKCEIVYSPILIAAVEELLEET